MSPASLPKQAVLQFGCGVTSAKRKSGGDLTIADDHIGEPLWIATMASGAWVVPIMVVCAPSFESAYESILDNLPTLGREDLPDAYGLESLHELDKREKLARENDGPWPELVAGYANQPNATDTGIVNVDGLGIVPLNKQTLRTYKLDIKIREVY